MQKWLFRPAKNLLVLLDSSTQQSTFQSALVLFC
jgi:hypothetical protein